MTRVSGPVYKNVYVFKEKWVPSDPPALSFFAQGGGHLTSGRSQAHPWPLQQLPFCAVGTLHGFRRELRSEPVDQKVQPVSDLRDVLALLQLLPGD